MTAIVFGGVAVLVAGLAHHAFIAWLAVRDAERLSGTDREKLSGRLDEQDKKLLGMKNVLDNLPRR